MNWKTIAVTAALLALQAVILSLLQSTTAQAEVVYRCGPGVYQAAPLGQRDQLMSQDKPAKPRRVKAALARASALSAESGMAPFHNGQWLSDAPKAQGRKDANNSKARRHRDFVARAPAAATGTATMLASNER
jgi:hypothetical protein